MINYFCDAENIVNILPCASGGFYVFFLSDEKTQNSSENAEKGAQNAVLCKYLYKSGVFSKREEAPKNIGSERGKLFEITKVNGKLDILCGKNKIPISEVSLWAKKIMTRPHMIWQIPDKIFEDKQVTKDLYDFEGGLIKQMYNKVNEMAPRMKILITRFYAGTYYNFEDFYREEQKNRRRAEREKLKLQLESGTKEINLKPQKGE